MNSQSSQDRKPRNPAKRRRRRRPGGKKRTPKQTEAKAADAVLEAESKIDTALPAEVPLTSEEVRAFTEHFAFLAKYRKVLRLKVNNKEDLLITGAKKPEHRGVCLHLLKKVDAKSIAHALGLMRDAESKTRFLGSVIRFYPDLPNVLLYLESLSASVPRDEAARALSVALERIDFSAVSKAQLKRVLALVSQTFGQRERPQVVLGLFQSASFRELFDASRDGLDSELESLFGPMRALYEALSGDGSYAVEAPELERGLSLMLQSTDATLEKLPVMTRERLFILAVELEDVSKEIERAINIILASFPRSERVYSRLALKRARQLLMAHRDDKARKVLNQLTTSHADFELPQRWLEALDKPRIGRVVLTDCESQEDVDALELQVVQRGFWLDEQKPVLVSLARGEEVATWNEEVALQERLCLPGLAPVLAHGKAKSGLHYMVLPPEGKPLMEVIRRRKMRPRSALRIAMDGVAILGGFTNAGVLLSEFGMASVYGDGNGRLWLPTLRGARLATATEAAQAHQHLALQWVEETVRWATGRRLDVGLQKKLKETSSLAGVMQVLGRDQ